jgi:hypothetical protein
MSEIPGIIFVNNFPDVAPLVIGITAFAGKFNWGC